jgi:DNA-directed RNA polymerase subunit alpha
MNTDQMPIEHLELSSRTYNVLRRSGVNTVGQLMQVTEDDLLGLPHFSRESLRELHEKMTQRGIIPPFAAQAEDSEG